VLVVGPGEGDRRQAVATDLKDWRRQEVLLETDRLDLGSRSLVILVDGVPVPLEQLAKPMRLLPGTHELLVQSTDGRGARQACDVLPGTMEAKVQTVAVKDPPAPVKVVVPETVQAILPQATPETPKEREKARDTIFVLALDDDSIVAV